MKSAWKPFGQPKMWGFPYVREAYSVSGRRDRQILELALTLKTLDVDAVPINFLVPVKGTSAEGMRNLTPAQVPENYFPVSLRSSR